MLPDPYPPDRARGSFRARSAARYLTAYHASATGGMAFGRPLQTAVQEPPIVATGRVCAVKYFGAGTPAGAVEPIWFNTTGAIAVGADSNLYSTSPQGGNHLAGTALRISPTRTA